MPVVAAPQAHDAAVQEVLDAFDAFARSVRRARGSTPAGQALTLSQYGLLEPLADARDARIGALAAAAGITASTATRILDALERRGIVVREATPGDRRAVSVRLTREGRAVLAHRREWVQAREREFYSGLGPDERQVAAALLRKLAGLIDVLGAGPSETAA